MYSAKGRCVEINLPQSSDAPPTLELSLIGQSCTESGIDQSISELELGVQNKLLLYRSSQQLSLSLKVAMVQNCPI